ncbi:uncharacterized protein LOC128230386 [Mya arenaria]|uniref:uncharacterized protein LOC128230386 n=1 Tax=Mya arenaria TaxID=6604 RepID=UPI0022E1AED0|nr:uncharacterized protein LOC128230386 [Mya arenaria]
MAFPAVVELPTLCRKKKDKTAYLNKPPDIKPNYGRLREKSLLPKTNISRVLLYDNAMQDAMLEVEWKYLDHQKRRVRLQYHKNRYAFVDQLKRRKRWHEAWEHGYMRIKDEFIAKYGTKNMPVPEEPPEIDPFFINARLVPPINVLCFYLESQQEEKKKKGSKTKESKAIQDRYSVHRPTASEYMYDHERLLGATGSVPMLYTHSVEDPRFRNLKESLVPPEYRSDGYIQLSPAFCQHLIKGRKIPKLRYRAIALPRFYARPHAASRDSVRSLMSRERNPAAKDSTFPPPDADNEDSLSSLSESDVILK